MITILEACTLSFAYSEDSGAYTNDNNPSLFTPVEGETYTVAWDGVKYVCTAYVSELLSGMVLLGNTVLIGGEDSGEPFAMCSTADGSGMTIFSATSEETHTLAVYQYEANDVSILNYSQAPVIYGNVPKVWLTHASGEGKVPFTYGEVLDGVEIQPDFAEGDMQISVPDGSLMKEATLVKPETLVPENVRYGTVIAGIEGKFLGDTEEIEVELDMADGDQVILPAEEGKSFSKVTVKKPDTLKPENIAKDVEIGGVVGTHEGSGADHYIFYTSDDGINVLLEKPIMHGDTAGDVIALGLMEEPSKEEENMENTFLGWSDAVGGEVKTTMFEDVTESRTVYAVFKSVAIVASGTCGAAATWKLNADGVMTISGEGAMTDFVAGSDQPWVDYANDITAVVIKGGVTTIGDYAFRNCSALTSIEIPDSVTIIGKSAFYGCAFASISIPDSVTSLGSGLFWGCTALTSIIIPDCVTEVPYAAFYKCSALNSVTIPDSVTYIGQYAFNSCPALKTVVIPDSVTSIDNVAFANSGLTSVTIGNGVITIGNNAFLNCTNLTSVTFKTISGWWVSTSSTATSGTSLSSSYLANTSTAATYLRSTYVSYYWKRS